MPEAPRPQPLAADQPLKASVLDRLITLDDEPAARSGASLRQIRESVRRDLENLVNTRPCCTSWPANLTELDDSLVNYGLPDFTGLNLSAPNASADFRGELQRLIEAFEPRLTNVSVQRTTKGEPLDRILSLRIEATLRVEPIEEPIAFNSTIEPVSASFAITRAER